MSAAGKEAVPERTPTPEQALAIAAVGSGILVEAGAGTGKTGVMVDRYCRLVCDEGIEPDAVLAFTFTDKAAAELRARIRAELGRRAGAGSERAALLLARIGSAWVTTIHGFCNRVLAGHPVAAGIDPGFRVLDAPEAERVSGVAFEEALEAFLAEGERSREETLAMYGIDGLGAIVRGAHSELRSRGVADPRLPEPPRPDPAAAVQKAAAAASEALAELKEGDRNRERLERSAEGLASAVSPSVDELVELDVESGARPLAAFREAIGAAIARTAEAGEGGVAYGHLAELLERFSERFAAAKERRAAVDFEDLQILAASLLERPEIGGSYRDRFSHMMVDEFQDTNRLQLRLIEALRGPRGELMVVGDEFQSIYGFRHADLEVFREQRREIEADPRGEAMELSGNFRSRPEVIGAVNLLSGSLLGADYRPLRVGAEPTEPAGPSPAVELLLTARDGWDEEDIDLRPAVDGRTSPNLLAEARFVAERLRALADEGIPRGEMVVLLRAFTHLDAYEDSLERAGLRPYVVGGRGYWSQQQVADVCALLATIANPLDDQALFGALASPACGVTPDTLWLLRAAAGRRRVVWPALERAVDLGEAEIAEPERLAQIPGGEVELLRRFVAAVAGLRERGTRLSLTALVEEAVAGTGYDLAILSRPSGEARLAAEYEGREGRDLRGLLDFLAGRAEQDAEANAATAVEGHDGVRIMTVHNAKGLEFGVVAVPDLARSLLPPVRAPLFFLGRDAEPRVGLQLRRLGAPKIDLFAYSELAEEAKARDAEEGLRLFHVAATRARRKLILSGVVKPSGNGKQTVGKPVVERIADAFELDREEDSSIPVPAPEPRAGLEAEFEPSEIAVLLNRPSPERAAQLVRAERAGAAGRALGEGPAPMVERHPPAVPSRPLSYSAIAAFEECGYRFYMERILGLGASAKAPGEEAPTRAAAAREERTARGAAVHSLLEWSAGNDWAEPDVELVRRHALAAGLEDAGDAHAESLLEPIRGWLGSALHAAGVGSAGGRAQAEAPLLLAVAGTILRGSIDLLVEREGEAPLVVDYKTDRLGGSTPAELAARYEIQRDIYALAVAGAREANEVEVAYVFLERPDEPAVVRLGAAEMDAGRSRIETAIERIEGGDFEVAAVERRDWSLCRGCPAQGRMCSGPSRDSG